MLGLFIVACGVFAAEAIVCTDDICKGVRCADVSACNGKVVPNGGFCGCCDTCVQLLGEHEKCGWQFLMGLPANTQCGDGLHCDPVSMACVKTVVKKQALGDCTIKQQQIQQGQQNGLPLLGVQNLKCNPDGSFSPVQCEGSVCYCVDEQGVEITGYRTSIGASDYATKNCQCARDKDKFQKTAMVGQVFNCEANGNYQQYRCVESVCFCTDDNGKQLGTASVNIGQLSTLTC